MPTDPFDFSDFGGPVAQPSDPHRPAGAPKPPARPAGRSGAVDFDPFADQPLVSLSAADAFDGVTGDSPGTPLRTLTVAGPPVGLFAAAFAIALAGAVLGLIATTRGSVVLLAFAGWLLAGPAAIGALAWFSGVDTRRRLSSVYSAPTWLHTMYWAVLATCAVGIALGALQIALWAGRQ